MYKLKPSPSIWPEPWRASHTLWKHQLCPGSISGFCVDQFLTPIHANCNAIGFLRENVLVPVAHVNSRDSSTPSLLLSNRQWAFMPLISQYPHWVQLSEHSWLGCSLCLDLWLYIGSTVLFETVVFAHTAMILVVTSSSSSNAILIALTL